jgi:Xaa-Pro dipeptidase
MDITLAQKAIREENLSGWLFYNVFHRDEISDLALSVPAESMNTRPWACAVYPDRPPRKLVHAIEAGILDHVPGAVEVYSSRQEFTDALSRLFPRGSRVGAQFSTRLPVGSFLDHGTALLFQRGGAELVPSENLVARLLGTLDEAGIRSHERAACALHEIVCSTWEGVSEAIRFGKNVHEGDVLERMVCFISECGMQTDSAPLVASRRGSGNPHYTPVEGGELLRPGDVVQLDIWAKDKAPGSIYADISWVGVLAEEPAPRYTRVFDAVSGAREAALALISEGLERGKAPSGAEVDRAARAFITKAGFGDALRHRTGHSIGERAHGFGVNLDSVEFPDDRLLSEGSCFSVEPGVYLSDFGMRTEINAYIHGGRLVVSGGERQARLLGLPR